MEEGNFSQKTTQNSDINNQNKETSEFLNETNDQQNNAPKKSNNKIIYIIGIIIFILILCGISWALWNNKSSNKTNNLANNTDNTANNSGVTKQAEAPSDLQTFITYSYNDPEANMEAFSILVPKGWQEEGSITWAPKVSLPANSNFRFYNPNGSEEFDIFPTQTYYWTNNQLALTTNPPGTEYFNTLVASPISINSAFSDVILPKFRSNVSNLKVIDEKNVPELAELAKGPATDGVNSQAEAGKIRIEYEENGKLMEEEIYAAVSQFSINLPGSLLTSDYFINYWYIDNIFSFKAEKGKLDEKTKLFETIIYSVKVNPNWFVKVANVKEQLAQMNIDQIKAIGQMGQMIAQAGSEMRADQQASWEYRQGVNDKIAENFSDYIRGVDGYNDPVSGEVVKLPSGYGNAWANNSGEYIVTESPSYNPNVESNLNWQQLEIAK